MLSKVASVAGLGLVAAALTAATARAEASPSPAPCGQLTSIPEAPTTYSTALYAISGTSEHDIWAAGNTAVPNSSPGGMTEHWNGSRWRWISGPPSAPFNAEIKGLTDISGSDAWAVGDATGGAYAQQWSGTEWTVNGPSGLGDDSAFSAVASTSSTDVWAVGFVESTGGTFHGLIEHYNGATWQEADNPDPASTGAVELFGVTAISPTNVYAVGFYDAPGTATELIEHYNGRAWTITDDAGQGALMAASGFSTGDVWTVGNSGPSELPVALHYNGAWATTTVPDPGSPGGFFGVTAAGRGFSVGTGLNNAGGETKLVEYWYNGRWHLEEDDGGRVAYAPFILGKYLWVVGYTTGGVPTTQRASCPGL